LVWGADSWSNYFLLFTFSPCLVVLFSSCIFRRTTKVQLLGGITFSYILELISARIEFTFCWSSLAWLRVIGPWSAGACVSDAWYYVTRGMSTSSSPSWKGVILNSVM
jgi:hypothetical protein